MSLTVVFHRCTSIQIPDNDDLSTFPHYKSAHPRLKQTMVVHFEFLSPFSAAVVWTVDVYENEQAEIDEYCTSFAVEVEVEVVFFEFDFL